MPEKPVGERRNRKDHSSGAQYDKSYRAFGAARGVKYFMHGVSDKNREKAGLRDFAVREDGSAMVIVLTIIFVMTTLGGITLLATLTNLRMSAKYTGWTAEYYALDRAAEDRVRRLDERLSQAEDYARLYIRGECYRIGDAAPAITGKPDTDINERAQNFIYNIWNNGVYQPSISSDSGGGDLTGGKPDILDETRYNSLFTRFNTEAFQRLYYFFAYRLLAADVKSGAFESVELTRMMAGYAGMLDNYSADPEGMKVVIDVDDGEEEYAKHVRAVAYVTAPIFGYETKAENIPFRANPLWSGALTARGSIKFESGQGINGSGMPSDGGSASGGGMATGTGLESGGGAVSGGLASGGGVTRVYGDVSAVDFNEFYIDQNDWASLEGNEFGIACAGAAVEIYGNVYSRGDLHVIDDGGRITVSRYKDGYDAGYRAGLFGNTLFFDTSTVPVMIQRYSQPDGGSWDRDFIPFFYRDNYGGNVYCNNLSISEGVRGASILIDNGPLREGGVRDGAPGVVWTLDDVHNGGFDSRISIKGNLIGLSSDAAFDDHTASSAVINSHYDSGIIELMGAIIVPGVAFMKFDGVNDLMDEDTFFETAQSVSAENPEILNAYMRKPSFEPDGLYYYDRYALNTERGMSDFFLVHYETLAEKARHVVSNLAGRAPLTGIVVGDAPEGYTRGAAFMGSADGTNMMYGPPGFGEIESYRELINYASNYLAYSEIKDSLKAAYKAKTESFGTKGYKFGDFIKLSSILDPSGKLYPGIDDAISFFAGDSVLELDGERGGIVYCAAAMDGSLPKLTIRGDGIFRGSIICEGDIVFEGSPTIYYDEKLIAKILLSHQEIRGFFSPGEMGETSYVRVMSVAQNMKKITGDRYRLADWAEWQE